jgi:hypothetical protein
VKFRQSNLQLIYVSDISVSTEYYKSIFITEPYFVTPRYVVFKIDGEANFARWSGGGAPDKDAPRYTEIGINLDTNNEVTELYNEWKTWILYKFTKSLPRRFLAQLF